MAQYFRTPDGQIYMVPGVPPAPVPQAPQGGPGGALAAWNPGLGPRPGMGPTLTGERYSPAPDYSAPPDLTANQPTPPAAPQTLQQQIVGAIPAGMATLGSIPGMMTGNPPLAVGGGALMGMAGKSIQGIAQKALGMPYPPTPGAYTRGVGREGTAQLGAGLAGELVTAPLLRGVTAQLGERMAFNPSGELMKRYRGLLGDLRDTGASSGSLFPIRPPSSPQAAQAMNPMQRAVSRVAGGSQNATAQAMRASFASQQLIKDATSTGMTASAADLAKPMLLKAQAENGGRPLTSAQTAFGIQKARRVANDILNQRTYGILGRNRVKFTPEELDYIRQTGVDPQLPIKAQSGKLIPGANPDDWNTVGKSAQDFLHKNIPGLAQKRAIEHRLMGVELAVKEMEKRNPLAWNFLRSGAAGAIGFETHSPINAGLAYLAASPPLLSRAAGLAGSPFMQGVAAQMPRLLTTSQDRAGQQ